MRLICLSALVAALFSLAFCSDVADPAQSPTFTLAMHITVTAADVHMLARFLDRTYHAQNMYLVDFAAGMSPSRQHVSSSVASAPNIYLREAEPSVPGGVSETLVTLSAMTFFLDLAEASGTEFHYFLNTSPREYPLVTADNARALLAWAHASASPPPNFLLFAPPAQWPDFTDRYNRLFYDPSIVFTRNATALGSLIPTLLYHPDRNRRSHTIAMSSTALVVSSEFVRLAADSMLSRRLLMLFAESQHSAEHFFATLALESENAAGKFVPTTSLRCPEMNAALQIGHLPTDSVPDPWFLVPGSEGELQPTPAQPCLFTAPILLDAASRSDKDQTGSASLGLRDAIDSKILSRQGPINTAGQGRLLETTLRLVKSEVLRVVAGDNDPDVRELMALQPMPL
jgi:hypothetical protein